MTGFKEPAAKGVIVSGIRAADINLDIHTPVNAVTTLQLCHIPLERPMIASMCRRWCLRMKGLVRL